MNILIILICLMLQSPHVLYNFTYTRSSDQLLDNFNIEGATPAGIFETKRNDLLLYNPFKNVVLAFSYTMLCLRFCQSRCCGFPLLHVPCAPICLSVWHCLCVCTIHLYNCDGKEYPLSYLSLSLSLSPPI